MYYDGSTYWDVGLLILAKDDLAFIGDSVRFRLSKDDIQEMVAPRIKRGIGAYLRIRWLDRVHQADGGFYLEPLAGPQSTSGFFRAMERWRRGDIRAALPARLDDLNHPSFPAVEAQPLGQVLSVGNLAMAIAWPAAFCLIASYFMGVPTDTSAEPSVWHAAALSIAISGGILLRERGAVGRRSSGRTETEIGAAPKLDAPG